MFEGIFGGPKKEEKPPVSANEIKLDNEDIEANRLANQIEKDAIRIDSITGSLLQNIDELIRTRPGIFSKNMMLEDFDSALKSEVNNYYFLATRQRLEEFLLLSSKFPENPESPDNIDFDNITLEEFIKVLEAKKIESDQVLHPKNYT
jgi:hypothetical protein